MAQDNLPASYQAGPPVRPAGGAVTRPGAPLHQPRQLDFAEHFLDRNEAWARIAPAVRERIEGRLGRRLEWWARDIDGRIHATVLGTRALIVLSPAVNASGQPATEIKTIRLDESSLRSARVSAPGGGALATFADRGSAHPQPSASPDRRLAEDMAGFLGWLPARAQQLLQDPFSGTSRELLYDYFYYRFGSARGLGGATLNIWTYITDKHAVTFCAGVGRGFHESTGVSSWELTCWRLDVERGSR